MTRWQSALNWWNRQRVFYNLALIAAGILSFALYVFAFELWAPQSDPEVEITVFTTAFQGIGYLLYMGIANLFFFLGPACEQMVSVEKITAYRRASFNSGLAISVMPPFAIPVLFYLTYGAAG